MLLDLEIPVRYSRPSRIQNGLNLLREIRGLKGYEHIPIIVMTSHGHDSPELAVQTLRGNGAIDFVCKPFADTGHTLEKAVLDALDASGRSRPGASKRSKAAKSDPPQKFEYGEMVFFDDRVELCGVVICGGADSGNMRGVLETLRQTNSHGRYVLLSGTKIAEAIGCKGGQGAISSAVRDFRDRVYQVMLEEANIEIDRMNDIITNNRRNGYRLSDKIVVRDAGDPASEPQTPNRDAVSEPQSDGVSDPAINDRQRWALERMRAGVRFRKADLVAQFKCSVSTAERDLRDLRSRGLIEFHGPPRTGYWRIFQG